jgi:hypothetical protein
MIASMLCLTLLSVSARPVLGQSPPLPQKLQIVVLDDGDPLVQRPAREPMVEVVDENNRPVAGAIVIFTVAGGSGEFLYGASSLTVATNQQGLARAAGFRPNPQNGEFVLQVLAKLQELRAETTIRQTMVSASAPAAEDLAPQPARHGHSKWILFGGAVAVGAVAAALAGRGSSSPAAPAKPTAVTITPGTGTVGAPK